MAEDKDRVVTPEGFLCFQHLLNVNEKSDNPKFEGMIVFDLGADLSELQRIAKAEMDKKWPNGRPDNFRSPFVDAATKLKYGEPFEEGKICVTARTGYQPTVVDAKVKPILNPGEIYSGMRVRFQVHAYAYDTKGNAGVAFGLDNVQKISDGAPLGGGVRAEDAFEPVEGDAGGTAAGDASGLL